MYNQTARYARPEVYHPHHPSWTKPAIKPVETDKKVK